MGHHARLEGNNHLFIWPTSIFILKGNPLGLDCARAMRVLMTQEIMRSSDAQCNTKESAKG